MPLRNASICLFLIALPFGATQFAPRSSLAQNQTDPTASLPDALDSKGVSDAPSAPDKVNIKPTAGDPDIATRLKRILAATDWFTDVEVGVDEGVVFLAGTAKNAEVKKWAGQLAARTQDVVAVVNQLELQQPPFWNFQPAAEGMRDLWHDTLAMTPFLLFGVVILVIAIIAAWLTAAGVRKSLRGRLASPLLASVLARAVGFCVLLLGLYIVLRVSGLTRLALTVVGGTGILGLVIGIAFRDITENFLASVLLSMRRPFLSGDLVEIASTLGYVQRLTTRATELMTLDGNHVEIPNSIVYKNTIRNFTTNKNRRDDFTIGIGYDATICEAQDIALRELQNHPAVLADPEPWALVDRLGSATVVLRIYYWIDGSKYSWLKVKSSVIRLVKRAFQDAGISIPDEAREVVFPQGIHVQMSPVESDGESTTVRPAEAADRKRAAAQFAEPVTTSAEGGLASEADELEQLAGHSRKSDSEDLLTAARKSDR